MDDGYNDGKTYCYIIPGGVNVIFKDEDGNEIMRYLYFLCKSPLI